MNNNQNTIKYNFNNMPPFLTATIILRSFMELAEPKDAFQWDGSWFGHSGTVLIDDYAGTTLYRTMLNNLSYTAIDIYNTFKIQSEKFKETRKNYLIY